MRGDQEGRARRAERDRDAAKIKVTSTRGQSDVQGRMGRAGTIKVKSERTDR